MLSSVELRLNYDKFCTIEIKQCINSVELRLNYDWARIEIKLRINSVELRLNSV